MKWCRYLNRPLTDKSQNAPVPYPTMHHSEQKCAHFCSEWCIVGYGAGASWGLWDCLFPPLGRQGPFVPQGQYHHGCWRPGNTRSQGISSCGIDLVPPEYSSLRTSRVDKMGTGISIVLISPKIFIFNPVLFWSNITWYYIQWRNDKSWTKCLFYRDIKGYLR